MIKAMIPWIKKRYYVSRNVMVLIIISMIANKFHFAGQLLFSLSRESNIVLFMAIQWKEALKKTCK